MSCRHVRHLLPRYVDQDLPAPEAALVAGHLERCPACRRRLQGHRLLLEALPALPEPEGAAVAGARLRRRVQAAVEVERRRRTRRGALERWGNALGWAAVATVALLLVVGLIASGRPLVAARWGAPRPTATATPLPLPPMAHYESPSLGFAVDYPASWTVQGWEASANAPGWRDLGGIGFVSDGYAVGSQAYGRYVLSVAVYDAEGMSAAEAVRKWLAPMDPGYRALVSEQPTTLAGEPAVALSGLPGYRFGVREVWAVHDGRLYIVRMTPVREELAEPVDVLARAAFDACLSSLRFIPASVTPAPPPPVPTPAPTPSAAPPTLGASHRPTADSPHAHLRISAR